MKKRELWHNNSLGTSSAELLQQIVPGYVSISTYFKLFSWASKYLGVYGKFSALDVSVHKSDRATEEVTLFQ